jgi:hypothetical protein
LRPTQGSRLIALPAAMALGLGLFAASLLSQPSVARAASGPLDAQASELVRLINGARAAEGRSPLSLDPFLASKARDGAIPCPDDTTKTIAGRARDFAAFGTMSHSLRLCNADSYTLSSTKYVSVLQSSWSYWNVGEINLVNGGYGNGAFLYAYGAWQTWTYSTTGHAMMGWKTSSSHWSIIVGAYDRVGCGGWASGSTFYYECSFSQGGSSPNGLRSPPTVSPFDNPLPTPTSDPTGTPTPQPTVGVTPSPTAGGTHAVPPGRGSGGSGGSPSRSPGATPGFGLSAGSSPVSSASDSDSTTTPAALSAEEASAKATLGSAAAPVGGSGAIDPSDGASALSGAITSVASVAGSGAAALACCCVSVLLLRRRRGGQLAG